MTLDDARDVTAECMDTIKSCFKAGVKITVAVRTPDFPDRDFVMTDDDLREVAAMMQRRHESERAALSPEGTLT